MHDDRYPADVLAGDWRNRDRVKAIEVRADPGTVIERADDGWTGAVVRVEGRSVLLHDRHNRGRVFPLGGGYLFEGRPARLLPPTPVAARPARTASGSVAAPEARARVARASRIYVEGRHDAELVEKVWGDDLRGEGVVVEYLGGIDDLPAILRDAAPTAERRIGVLVDHLVPGSKESRIRDEVARGPHGSNVLVVGHPYIDIWQAVRPERLGIDAWPEIPRGTDWKTGVLRSFGWPAADQADIARGWKRILGRVEDFRHLEPALLGRVEELIDFTTVGSSGGQ